jgi:hypothetical protein
MAAEEIFSGSFDSALIIQLLTAILTRFAQDGRVGDRVPIGD